MQMIKGQEAIEDLYDKIAQSWEQRTGEKIDTFRLTYLIQEKQIEDFKAFVMGNIASLHSRDLECLRLAVQKKFKEDQEAEKAKMKAEEEDSKATAKLFLEVSKKKATKKVAKKTKKKVAKKAAK